MVPFPLAIAPAEEVAGVGKRVEVGTKASVGEPVEAAEAVEVGERVEVALVAAGEVVEAPIVSTWPGVWDQRGVADKPNEFEIDVHHDLLLLLK